MVSIFLYEPANVTGESSLTISRVIHGYRGAFVNLNGGMLGSSESCNNDIACFPEYLEESKAIALVLLASGTELCSGSLIMTTDFSFKPYFLTAFHCIDTSPIDLILSDSEKSNVNNWLFKFNYRKADCNNGQFLSTSYTYDGATFKAASSNTDFALLELNSNLSLYPNRHTWLGWDRNSNTPSSGVCIHHPTGDVMKISIEDNPFSSSSWYGNNNHWLVSFDDGVVQHGSSGSPLLNSNSQIVGQLHGNQNYNKNISFCSQPRAEYGKFYISWNGNNANETSLYHWLDPIGTNHNSMIGSFQMTVSGSGIICSQETYTINNLPSGASVALNTTISSTGFSIIKSANLSIISYSEGSLTVQKISNGAGYIKVYYKGYLLATKEVWVGAPVITDVYYQGGNIYVETSSDSEPYLRSFYVIINGTTYRPLGGMEVVNLQNGTYNIEAYASNECGESDHYFGQIVVSGNSMYSIGDIDDKNQVTINATDYGDAPLPLEASTKDSQNPSTSDEIPYTLKSAQTGELVAQGAMSKKGGVLDFSFIKEGIYVLTIMPITCEPETFKLSLK